VADKLDRKALKGNDQFIGFWVRATSAASAHRRALLTGVAVTLVVVGASWAAYGYSVKREARASAAFARIAQVASAAKTDEERFKAALKESEAFLLAYRGSDLRDEALLVKAKYLLSLGQAKEAGAVYRALLEGAVDKRLKFLAQEGLGYALEATAKLDEAIAVFDAAAKDAERAGNFHRDQALFHKARLLAKKGDGKQAKTVFRKILEVAPQTSLRDQIDDRLAVLDKK
jgi:tetratricopeptide (TPR) repeat protein